MKERASEVDFQAQTGQLLDGPGLDLEPMRQPSTTNVTTTFFKQKGFKKLTGSIRASSTVLNTLVNGVKPGKKSAEDQEAITL